MVKLIKLSGDLQLKENFSDTISNWMKLYFSYEVTTSDTSRKMQHYDLKLFINYMKEAVGSDERMHWTPRLSRAFMNNMKSVIDEKSQKRRWSDRTINRVFAHLKTFARWIHKLSPFPLGNPLAKIKMNSTTTGLEIERALTSQERNNILDAADLLLNVGGFSKDRNRYRKKTRPKRKGYRPYRNRAIIYTLIETGMRRVGVVNLNIEDINFKERAVTVLEKGGVRHTYLISKEGLEAIKNYIKKEREFDNEARQSNALFLPARSIVKGKERLTGWLINKIWNEVCAAAGVVGKTPHSARHAMGRHIMEKKGNVAAVQRQLGHRNAAYSMQYARITAEELRDVLDDR